MPPTAASSDLIQNHKGAGCMPVSGVIERKKGWVWAVWLYGTCKRQAVFPGWGQPHLGHGKEGMVGRMDS
jgi:hypothetical protein